VTLDFLATRHLIECDGDAGGADVGILMELQGRAVVSGGVNAERKGRRAILPIHVLSEPGRSTVLVQPPERSYSRCMIVGSRTLPYKSTGRIGNGTMSGTVLQPFSGGYQGRYMSAMREHVSALPKMTTVRLPERTLFARWCSDPHSTLYGFRCAVTAMRRSRSRDWTTEVPCLLPPVMNSPPHL